MEYTGPHENHLTAIGYGKVEPSHRPSAEGVAYCALAQPEGSAAPPCAIPPA
jgi:hypothetical protein